MASVETEIIPTASRHRVLLTHILLAVLFIGLLAVSLTSPSRNSFREAQPTESVIYREQSVSPFNFRASLNLVPPDATDEDNILHIQLTKIEYELASVNLDDPETQKRLDQDQFCIQSIVIFQTAADAEDGAPINADSHKFYDQNESGLLCGEVGKDSFDFGLKEQDANTIAKSVNSPNSFLYPFDDFKYQFYVEVYYLVLPKTVIEGKEDFRLSGSGSDEVSRYIFTNSSKTWQYTPSPSVVTWIDGSMWDFMEINFTRPFTTKALSLGIVSIVLILIVSMALIDKFNELFEPGIAIIFGIFSIHQMIIPDGITVQTFWDYVIIGLSAFFVLAILLHFFKRHQVRPLAIAQPMQQVRSKYLIDTYSKLIHVDGCQRAATIPKSQLLELTDTKLVQEYRKCPYCYSKNINSEKGS